MGVQQLVQGITWYLFLMPLWCFIANIGKNKLAKFQEVEAQKSPHTNRLGKCAHQAPQLEMKRPRGASLDQSDAGLVRPDSLPDVNLTNTGPKLLPYGALSGGNKAIGAAIVAKKKTNDSSAKEESEEDEVADVDVPPTWYDFCVAIFFIAFGMVALCAGMVSIVMTANVEVESEVF